MDKKSLTKEAFIDPRMTITNIKNEKRETFKLMNTNFVMGDKENPKNTYMTIYKKELDGRPCKSPVKNLKKAFGINLKISNNESNDYLSEKQLR